MAFKRPLARILENTVSTGNGPYATSAVRADFNRFSSFMSVGDTTFATVNEPGVAFWTGIVTYSAANQITLTTVEESTGTFGAGTKEIFAGTLAARSAFPDDIAGAIVTGGSSTAYTVASYRVYDTLARMSGALIAFTPHASNGATVTLNVDGLGAKPLRPARGVELQSNVLIAGTPYMATYNNSDAVWYLHGLGGNTYGVPLLVGLEYWDTVTPSSAFIFPTGQALSRAAYPYAFSRWGTTYGAGLGDGLTFSAPDKTGRVSAMKEASATRLTASWFGGNSTNLGAVGGSESHVLTTAQLASHSHANSLFDPGHSHTYPGQSDSADLSGGPSVYFRPNVGTSSTAASFTGLQITNAAAGSGSAHNNTQPTIVCNYILRVL